MPRYLSRVGRRREIVVLIALTILGGGGLFWAVLLLTGLLGVAVLAGICGIAVLGVIHYLVWGRAMSEELAARGEAPRFRPGP